MRDLIVIGAGFYGIAAAMKARELGSDVLVIDDEHPASGSRNAAGILHPIGPTVAKRVPWAQPNTDWLWFAPPQKWPEANWSYQRPSAALRVRDVELVVVQAILGHVPHVYGHVLKLTRTPNAWILQGSHGEEWFSRQVLVCAGVWSNGILVRSGLPAIRLDAVRGRALLFSAPSYRRDCVWSWTIRPYTTFTMRPTLMGLWRFGDSVERTSHKSFSELCAAADRHVPGITVGGVQDGLRPHTGAQAFTELVAPGLVVSTGAYRNGLALAGIAADRALELLGW